MKPENSYRVTLDKDGDLLWTTEDGDTVSTFDREPDADFWKRFTAGLVKLLPVENQL